ncbi:MAG: PAS domain-containing protein [Parvibaculaceae bacterium]
MTDVPSGWSEAARLSALHDYRILDTPPEAAFEDMAKLAGAVCAAPVALVSFVAEDRQWFKAAEGIDVRETPLDSSICRHAIQQGGLFVVPDTRLDPRTAVNPLVSGPPHFRFYAGAVIETPDGLPLGTLCVLDHAPRPQGLTEVQAQALHTLAQQVMTQLELRRTLRLRADSETSFRIMADSISQLTWMADPGGRIFWFNRRWYDFTGTTPDAVLGQKWRDLIHPDHAADVGEGLSRALETGSPWEHTFPLRSRHGDYRWFLTRAMPFRDETGRIFRWFGTNTDITEALDVDLRLKESEERLEEALDASRVVGTWAWDVEANRIHGDARFARLYGIAPELAEEGADPDLYLDLVHPEDRGHVREKVLAALRERARLRVDYRVPKADGSFRWMTAVGRISRVESGRAVKLTGVVVDISERKEAEEARILVSRELNHRIKNIFALTSGLISLSARDYPEAADFSAALRGRLASLSRAHDYVRPSGEGEPARLEQTLHGLIRALLEPYGQSQRERFTITGEDLPVGSGAATALALIVHEFATNALKYGSLATENGHVAIAGTRNGDTYELTWRESGGPEIIGPPDRRGFGSQMADRAVTGQLGGTIERTWPGDGLLVRVTAPVDRFSN